jgi:hypothetical protein
LIAEALAAAGTDWVKFVFLVYAQGLALQITWLLLGTAAAVVAIGTAIERATRRREEEDEREH